MGQETSAVLGAVFCAGGVVICPCTHGREIWGELVDLLATTSDGAADSGWGVGESRPDSEDNQRRASTCQENSR